MLCCHLQWPLTGRLGSTAVSRELKSKQSPCPPPSVSWPEPASTWSCEGCDLSGRAKKSQRKIYLQQNRKSAIHQQQAQGNFGSSSVHKWAIIWGASRGPPICARRIRQAQRVKSSWHNSWQGRLFSWDYKHIFLQYCLTPTGQGSAKNCEGNLSLYAHAPLSTTWSNRLLGFLILPGLRK